MLKLVSESLPGCAGPLGIAAEGADCRTTSWVVVRSLSSKALRIGGTYGSTSLLLLLMRAPRRYALSAIVLEVL